MEAFVAFPCNMDIPRNVRMHTAHGFPMQAAGMFVTRSPSCMNISINCA